MQEGYSYPRCVQEWAQGAFADPASIGMGGNNTGETARMGV